MMFVDFYLMLLVSVNPAWADRQAGTHAQTLFPDQKRAQQQVCARAAAARAAPGPANGGTPVTKPHIKHTPNNTPSTHKIHTKLTPNSHQTRTKLC